MLTRQGNFGGKEGWKAGRLSKVLLPTYLSLGYYHINGTSVPQRRESSIEEEPGTVLSLELLIFIIIALQNFPISTYYQNARR